MMDRSLSIPGLHRQYRAGDLTPTALIDGLLKQITAHGQCQNIWLHLLTRAELQPYLDRLQGHSPATLPLYGIPFAIKDNIDLAGVPTTAACPAFSRVPDRSATVVQRLIDAGAIPLGKTNLDQFATGLVGVRSPYGTPSNPFNPAYIPGGSSSGSAVAVALGQASFALGTDTAGSGRVPAAFCNLVGIKPTRGLLSTTGVVPACRTLDCVSIFTTDVTDGALVLEVAQGFDHDDPYSRPAPSTGARLSHRFRFAVPPDEELEFFGNGDYQRLFGEAVGRLEALGGERVVSDFRPFREAAQLLYDGPWVAERYAVLHSFMAQSPEALLPVTNQIISQGAEKSAADTFRAMYRLQELRREVDTLWQTVDLLVTPTAGTIYRCDQVAADPIRLNSNLGYYTNFMNLLDLSACALPAGFTTFGLPFGITLAAPAFQDDMLVQLGKRFTTPDQTLLTVAVCGAHLRGLPLNYQLVELGGRFVREARTAPWYRLYALNTTPPKPGMLRVASGGSSIELEIWELPAAGLGQFLAGIPAPLGLGMVDLEDGGQVTCFLVESAAVVDAPDITRYGGWKQYLASHSS